MTKTGKIIIMVLTILTILITLTVIGIVHFFSSYTSTYLINEGIKLSRPKKEEEKFLVDYREGEEFVILRYDEKNIKKIKNIKNISNENIFKKITKENIEEVSERTNYFYRELNNREKKIFDKSITITELTQYGNYYVLHEKNKCNYSLTIIYKNDVYYMQMTEPCSDYNLTEEN